MHILDTTILVKRTILIILVYPSHLLEHRSSPSLLEALLSLITRRRAMIAFSWRLKVSLSVQACLSGMVGLPLLLQVSLVD